MLLHTQWLYNQPPLQLPLRQLCHQLAHPLCCLFLLTACSATSSRWLLQHRSKTRPKKEDIDLLSSTRSVHLVRHYYLSFISQLAQRCRLRQRVVATAQVFFRRFYTQSSLAQHDPALIAVTTLLIAAKVEECAINAKALAKQLQPTTSSGSGSTIVVGWQYSVSDVLDCEFVVLHSLLFDLVIFHPYRPLVHFLSAFAPSNPQHAELVQHSWELVNESYYSDVVMLYPPYVIAISCVYMAAHMLNIDYRAWLRGIVISQQVIADCTHQLLQHIDRRQALHPSSSSSSGTSGGSQPVVVDVLGCVLDVALVEALKRLQEHHQQGGRKAVGAAIEDGDKVGSEDVGMDAAVMLDEEQDSVVVLGDKVTDSLEDAQGAARKKQKIDNG